MYPDKVGEFKRVQVNTHIGWGVMLLCYDSGKFRFELIQGNSSKTHWVRMWRHNSVEIVDRDFFDFEHAKNHLFNEMEKMKLKTLL